MIARVKLLSTIAWRFPLPQHFAGRAIDGQAEQPAVSDAGQENPIAVDDRRGVSLWQIGLPDDVAGWAEFDGKTGDFGDAGAIGSAESCSLAVGARRRHEQRHHQQRLKRHVPPLFRERLRCFRDRPNHLRELATL